MIRLIVLLTTSVITVRAASDMYDEMKKFIRKHSDVWIEKTCAKRVNESC